MCSRGVDTCEEWQVGLLVYIYFLYVSRIPGGRGARVCGIRGEHDCQDVAPSTAAL